MAAPPAVVLATVLAIPVAAPVDELLTLRVLPVDDAALVLMRLNRLPVVIEVEPIVLQCGCQFLFS